MSECPQKDTIKGAPHAPVRRFGGRARTPAIQKKGEVVAVVQEITEESDSEDDEYYYHLDNLVTYHGCWKSKGKPIVHPEASLFLDESEASDQEEEVILIDYVSFIDERRNVFLIL